MTKLGGGNFALNTDCKFIWSIWSFK